MAARPKGRLWRERLGSRGRIADRGGQMGIEEQGEPDEVEEFRSTVLAPQTDAEEAS